MNLANAITIFRLLLIPMVIGATIPTGRFQISQRQLCLPWPASVIARWLPRQTSGYRDKLRGISGPGGRQTAGHSGFDHAIAQFPVLLLPAMIIISREIVISALREWMASRGSVK